MKPNSFTGPLSDGAPNHLPIVSIRSNGMGPLALNPGEDLTMSRRNNTKSRAASVDHTAGNGKLLYGIGLIGLSDLEPIILAALATEVPLLLIGSHGTGKSLLLTRIAEALGLAFRHYNASLLNFDDLVGLLFTPRRSRLMPTPALPSRHSLPCVTVFRKLPKGPQFRRRSSWVLTGRLGDWPASNQGILFGQF